MNLEIAHIHAANEDGPRFSSDLSERQRDSFDNLILLCKPHHETVDKDDPESFPVEVLKQWKSQRETSGQSALAGLRNLTEERLQEVISEALEFRDNQMQEALDRFTEIDSEAAEVLRGLVNELDEVQRHGPVVSEDVAGMLAVASDKLVNLEDTAGVLIRAAELLQNTEDFAVTLNRAANKAMNLQDVATSLNDATGRANGLADVASDLHRAASRMQEFR